MAVFAQIKKKPDEAGQEAKDGVENINQKFRFKIYELRFKNKF